MTAGLGSTPAEPVEGGMGMGTAAAAGVGVRVGVGAEAGSGLLSGATGDSAAETAAALSADPDMASAVMSAMEESDLYDSVSLAYVFTLWLSYLV